MWQASALCTRCDVSCHCVKHWCIVHRLAHSCNSLTSLQAPACVVGGKCYHCPHGLAARTWQGTAATFVQLSCNPNAAP